jgi:hypothetical protein
MTRHKRIQDAAGRIATEEIRAPRALDELRWASCWIIKPIERVYEARGVAAITAARSAGAGPDSYETVPRMLRLKQSPPELRGAGVQGSRELRAPRFLASRSDKVQDNRTLARINHATDEELRAGSHLHLVELARGKRTWYGAGRFASIQQSRKPMETDVTIRIATCLSVVRTFSHNQSSALNVLR